MELHICQISCKAIRYNIDNVREREREIFVVLFKLNILRFLGGSFGGFDRFMSCLLIVK